MDDQTKMALAAAIAGGYVLGRTKKGKLALSVGTYLAGRRFGLEPRQLAAEGMRRLGQIPQVAELQDQLKGEFLDAGRKAVTAAATRGMGTLAETLRDRTADLGKQEEEEPDEEFEEEEESEPDRRQRRSSRKQDRPERGTSSRRERSPSARRKKTSATKPTARKAAPAKASATSKRSSGQAGQTASSGRAAKKASKRPDRRR
ncbi:hypothetical protein [Streptomyces sp. NPDC059828]|uniref:hypothetical protein n=1 Tax=Streptomyces sp. NPDC059828 TaxID=3346965 RepID=UPI00365F4880